MATPGWLIPALLAAVGLNAVVAGMAVRRRGEEPGAAGLTVFATALGAGTLTVVMEISVASLSTKVVWFGTGVTLQALVAGSWLYFSLAYTGLERWTGRRLAALLAVEPTLVGVATVVPNARSLLVRPPETVPPGTELLETAGSTFGPLYVLHGLYAFLMVLAATVVFVRFFLRMRRLAFRQAAAVLSAALLPWAAILFEAFSNALPVDSALFAWPLAGLVMAVALSRIRVLDPVPAGRQTVVEEMGDGVVLVDRRDQVGDVNPAACDLLGVDTDVVGRPVDAVLPSWERIRDADDWAEVSFETDGDERFVEAETTPFYDQHDRLVGRLVVLRDVTERERRERSLARYKTVFESVQDRVFVLDETGQFVLVNEPFAALVDSSVENLMGTSFEDLLAATSIPEAPTTADEPVEVTVVTDSGREIPCEVSLAPVAFGDVEGSVGVVHDITERKRVEQSLQETTERFETLVEASPVAIVAADTDGVVEVWNPAAEELFGWEAEEVIGEPLPIIPEENVETVEENHQRVLSGETLTGLDVSLERIDGTLVETSVSIAPIHGPSGEVEGTVSVILDVTERRQRERKLRRQNERLEEFASIISHDLRNPLQVAQGYVDHMRETDDSDHLEEVGEALVRMDELIDSVLTLARKGRDIENPEPVEFEPLVSLAWDRVPTASATLETRSVPAAVMSDETRLTELLENLFRNSVDHGGSDVTVTVGALDDGFYVEDDGPGIPDDVREEVFESGYTTDDDGSGLGLAIVRRIAEAHGWDVTLTDGDAGGARFEFHGVERPQSPTESA